MLLTSFIFIFPTQNTKKMNIKISYKQENINNFEKNTKTNNNNILTQYALILDGSNSIIADDWNIMRQSIADSIREPEYLPHDGSVELTVIQFGTNLYCAEVVVSPTIVTNANYDSIATQIETMAQGQGWTPMAAAIYLAANQLYNSPNFNPSYRQVINLVTDGVPNICSGPEDFCGDTWTTQAQGEICAENAKDYLLNLLQMTENQDEFDSVAVVLGPDVDWLRYNIVWPQPGYNDWPPDGPGWVREVDNYDIFSEIFSYIFESNNGNQLQMIKPVDDSRGDIWIGADVGSLQHYRGYWYHSYNPNNNPEKNRLDYKASPVRDPKLDMLVFKGGIRADGVTVEPFHVRYPDRDATVGEVTYHNYQVYHEGIDISAGSKIPNFIIGDWIRTTINLRVRTGPGLSYDPPLAIMPIRSVGQIVDGPADDVDGNNYVWWKIRYNDKDKTTGWSAQLYLEHSIYGRDVYAAASGKVVHVDPTDDSSAGKWIWIYHGDIKKLDGTIAPMISTRYMHLNTIEEDIVVGMDITKGTKIGTVGDGGTYFPHLHFEVRQGDTKGLQHRNTWPYDPLDFVDYDSVQRAEGRIVATCPVDLIITDPDGFVISKDINDLPLSTMYVEANYDNFEEGSYDRDDIILYNLKLGDYLITVIPEPSANPTDTYSLEMHSDDIIIVVAKNVQISNIPDHPYLIRITETEIIQIIPINIDINPDTLNLNSTGKWITCYIELPAEFNVANINTNTILLNDVVSAESHPINISDYDEDGIPDLMVKFDRQDVIDILSSGDYVEIKITGELTDGTKWEGVDYIKVI